MQNEEEVEYVIGHSPSGRVVRMLLLTSIAASLNGGKIMRMPDDFGPEYDDSPDDEYNFKNECIPIKEVYRLTNVINIKLQAKAKYVSGYKNKKSSKKAKHNYKR